MNYNIYIIDTQTDTHVTITELAARDSIALSYSGSDAKDELVIVGSSLRFNMAGFLEDGDGKYLHLFTGDEKRYKIELKRATDNLLIWNGFLLPDSYSEPWQNGVQFINFEATDGLGRLKGKFLPDSFYNFENNVVSIIASCLELTGLQMPIYLSLGIDNTVQKYWHTIYIDGLHFVSKNKKQDAYAILQSICADTVSCVFQDLGKWYVIGLNKRSLVSYTVSQYSYLGVYVSDVQISKNQKEITKPMDAPNITMVAPYNIITVEHERNEVKLPDTIAKEINDGWAVVTGVIGEVYASNWVGNGGCYVLSKHSDYQNIIKSIGYQTGLTAFDYAFDDTKFVNLNNKIYLKALQKVSFEFEFLLNILPDKNTYNIDDVIDAGYWKNPFIYEITFNNTIILTNSNKELVFDDTKKATIEFDYIPSESGVLDIKLYQTHGMVTNHKIKYITLNTIKLEDVDFEETYTSVLTISDDYTIDKDVALTFADDASGFSKAFLLEKLREPFGSYDEIDVPILYGNTYLGIYYSVVQLNGANLIKDNILTTYYGDTLLENIAVEYNYKGGEQMVVITNAPYTSGSFTVRVYNTNNYTGSRANWEIWTDSVYNIERLRYADAVSNVYRRLFKVPHHKVDLEVQFPVSFNDILVWNYLAVSNYYVINSTWNLDKGISTITMCKAVYQNDDTISPGTNIPPIVSAGETIYIASGATTATLTSVGYDPDGFIVSYLWEKLSGTDGTIVAPINQNTNLTGLTADEYEFKITVTDDDAATAFDTVKVIRILDYILDVTLTDTDTDAAFNRDTFSVEISPEILASSIVKITGTYTLEAISKNVDNYALSYVQIIKNGATILNDTLEGVNEVQTTPFQFLYTEGDVISIVIYAEARLDDVGPSPTPDPEATATINFLDFEQVAGSFNITNLPITKTVTHTE